MRYYRLLLKPLQAWPCACIRGTIPLQVYVLICLGTYACACAGTVHFGRINMKPGKPATFASVPVTSMTGAVPTPSSSTTVAAGAAAEKLVFALPGNPVSSLVCFHLFVHPAIVALSGRPYVHQIECACVRVCAVISRYTSSSA